ncbi:hypothetical protein BDR26DRAFT_915377, partial [Obelidium mucronatum]
MAFERERNSNIDLSNKLKTLQKLTEPEKSRQKSGETNGKEPSSTPSEISKYTTEIKNLKDKLSSMTRKFEDERIGIHAIKAELANTQKALALEVFGDDSALSRSKALAESLSNSSTATWKGRAQQIQLLKERVRELSRTMGHEVDNSHHESIRKISERRHEAFDVLTADYNKLSKEYSEMKGKYEAVQARNKTLEKDLKSCKSKLQLLVDKATNDDTLIQ